MLHYKQSDITGKYSKNQAIWAIKLKKKLEGK